MYILMQIVFFCLNIPYFFIKLFCPVKHKVVFLSRQSNQPSADLLLVEQQLKKDDPTIETVQLCKTLDGGIGNKVKYALHMFQQMYHIATSEVAVLDTYCIVISCLHHRKSLKVVQMWHGLGCAKKFGYSIIGNGEGSSLKTAKSMHMHEQYDYVFTSSEKCKAAFAEGFNVDESKLVIAPLPKVDLFRDVNYRKEMAETILNAHPELKGKPIVVYQPTFRKDEQYQKVMIQKLIDEFDYDKFHLVLSLHPISKISFDDPRIVVDRNFYSFQWSMVADKIITDYSSTVYEIALMDKEIYYYVYDYDTYLDIRGMYTMPDEFPGPKCVTVSDLMLALDNTNYDLQAVKNFADCYVDPFIKNCTAHISDIIRNYPLNH